MSQEFCFYEVIISDFDNNPKSMAVVASEVNWADYLDDPSGLVLALRKDFEKELKPQNKMIYSCQGINYDDFRIYCKIRRLRHHIVEFLDFDQVKK